MFSGGDEAGKASKSKTGDDGDRRDDSQRDKDRARRRKGINSPSILSADLRILGDVETPGDLHIDGVILGDVRSKRVTVGKDGEVKGAIHGEEVNIRGQVAGEVVAHAVTLSKTARVEATITHELLTVEPGAELLGRTQRKATVSETAAAPVPETAADAEPSPDQPAVEPATSAEPGEGATPGEEPVPGETAQAAASESVEDSDSLVSEPESDKPIFEPLPAVIAAGPADLDASLAVSPQSVMKRADGKAEGSAKSEDSTDSGSRTGIRFRPLGASQATP